jgi:ketosteroid isomerase-like protein
MAPTASAFDLEALRRGIEQSDADTMASLFAEDGELTEVDKDHPPRSPNVYRGREAIADHFREVGERDMSHRLERPVVSDGRLAFTEACLYDDGTNVLCMATADLDSDNMIRSMTAVTAWDA